MFQNILIFDITFHYFILKALIVLLAFVFNPSFLFYRTNGGHENRGDSNGAMSDDNNVEGDRDDAHPSLYVIIPPCAHRGSPTNYDSDSDGGHPIHGNIHGHSMSHQAQLQHQGQYMNHSNQIQNGHHIQLIPRFNKILSTASGYLPSSLGPIRHHQSKRN